MTKPRCAIAIHGGAGTLSRSSVTPAIEREYLQKLSESLQAGYQILQAGGSALDAVVAAVVELEDSPLFNAGRGSVYTHDETIEMDASVMLGGGCKAGAVARVTTIKNPIKAARAVMEQSEHVLLSGEGADLFAKGAGCESVDPAYFAVPSRLEQLREAQKQQKIVLDHDDAASSLGTYPDKKFGTVGAVALDIKGDLAAGTSTGGMTNKRYGRIGDSSIIGAGTYADNATCAVSCTGHGEFFIRNVVAHDVAALMKYRGLTLAQATNHVVNEKLVAIGGRGGLIALDREGTIVMPFNTPGMYRGAIGVDGACKVAIFGE